MAKEGHVAIGAVQIIAISAEVTHHFYLHAKCTNIRCSHGTGYISLCSLIEWYEHIGIELNLVQLEKLMLDHFPILEFFGSWYPPLLRRSPLKITVFSKNWTFPKRNVSLPTATFLGWTASFRESILVQHPESAGKCDVLITSCGQTYPSGSHFSWWNPGTYVWNVMI